MMMITKQEIDEKAAAFEIHPSSVQRDYVFGWLLFGLFRISSLKDQLFLKGGNALRKGYFGQTRFSSDIDLGIPGDLDPQVLRVELDRICDLVEEKSGVTFSKADTRIEEKFLASDRPVPDLKVFEVRVYFKDFYGTSDHIRLKIKMDLTRFDRALLAIQTVALIHPYSDSAEVACQIRCMKLEEIIATKLKCLLQREHAPDLFDYVYAIRQLGGELDRAEVARTFLKKTIFERNPHFVKRILRQTPWEFCREFWNGAIVCAKAVAIQVEDAIAESTADLEQLFGGYRDNGYAEFAFFSPEFRVSIMKAARTQTLLKVRYKDEDRVVEPYSLKYMERRDGGQREYFYAFNRTGGEHNPGIRAFVMENAQAIENTEERFEPRYPIELSKAGELPEDRYLFDPDKPARAPRQRGIGRTGFPRRRSTAFSGGPKYVYQCMMCGRKFTKTQQSSAIGAHKGRSGFACPGRVGLYVDMKF